MVECLLVIWLELSMVHLSELLTVHDDDGMNVPGKDRHWCKVYSVNVPGKDRHWCKVYSGCDVKFPHSVTNVGFIYATFEHNTMGNRVDGMIINDIEHNCTSTWYNLRNSANCF